MQPVLPGMMALVHVNMLGYNSCIVTWHWVQYLPLQIVPQNHVLGEHPLSKVSSLPGLKKLHSRQGAQHSVGLLRLIVQP
jgi:hypothetical protein